MIQDRCSTSGCYDPIKFKQRRLCSACGSWRARWVGRPPEDVKKRIYQIKRLGARVREKLYASTTPSKGRGAS